MSKKNKRYLLCSYSGHINWYGVDWDPKWFIRKIDREGLVLKFAQALRADEAVFDYITDDLSVIPERVTKVPYTDRPGIKSYKNVYHTVYCVKVLKGGVEYPVDFQALRREAEKKYAELYDCKPKHRNHNWSWGHPSWKSQYKCKHQWEIHQRKKVYVEKTSAKSYDPSWESDDLDCLA